MTSNIPAVLKQKKDNQMLLGMSQTWLGVSILLLAAVAPLARMYNAATRVYASIVEPKKDMQEWSVLDEDVENLLWVHVGDSPTQSFKDKLSSDREGDDSHNRNDKFDNFII